MSSSTVTSTVPALPPVPPLPPTATLADIAPLGEKLPLNAPEKPPVPPLPPSDCAITPFEKSPKVSMNSVLVTEATPAVPPLPPLPPNATLNATDGNLMLPARAVATAKPPLPPEPPIDCACSADEKSPFVVII